MNHAVPTEGVVVPSMPPVPEADADIGAVIACDGRGCAAVPTCFQWYQVDGRNPNHQLIDGFSHHYLKAFKHPFGGAGFLPSTVSWW